MHLRHDLRQWAAPLAEQDSGYGQMCNARQTPQVTLNIRRGYQATEESWKSKMNKTQTEGKERVTGVKVQDGKEQPERIAPSATT